MHRDVDNVMRNAIHSLLLFFAVTTSEAESYWYQICIWIFGIQVRQTNWQTAHKSGTCLVLFHHIYPRSMGSLDHIRNNFQSHSLLYTLS